MKNYIDFLLESKEPWIIYKTMTDLLGYDKTDSRVIKAREDMLSHPLILGLIEELKGWPGVVISSHKSAGQFYHKLSFLAEMGITKEDDGISEILRKVMEHRSDEGLFQLPTNIPVHFGGSGKQEWAWALCDAPLLLFSLAKMGFKDNPDIKKGVEYLISLLRENGWPCAVSKELGKFRGPGRKDDPCPYATLIMLKLMSLYDDYKTSKEAEVGANSLLYLWEKSMELHPYMFFMGTDFRKLKAPLVWYDILHVAYVLSHFDFLKNDIRLKQMVEIIKSKADADGLFMVESIYKAWSDWEFGQKKKPSYLVTLFAYIIIKNFES